MNKKVFLFSIIFLICVFIALSFGHSGADDSFRHERIAAPDFSLKDVQGKTFKLSRQRGNPVVIFFGATWCPACRAEMPNYRALYEKYARRGLKFVYIDINESTERVARFSKTNSFPYLVLVDTDGSVASDYSLIGVPTLFLIDKDGNIISIGHQISDLSIDALFPAKR